MGSNGTIRKVDISVELCGLKLKNPILTAAGPPVRDAQAILACAKGGAGAIVTKTISTKGAAVPRPCMAELKHGFINTELWSELAPEQWLSTEYRLAKRCELPLIISLGYDERQICQLAPKVLPYADALELSTHYLGKDTGLLTETVSSVKELVDIPVIVKLSPSVPDIKAFAKAAVKGGADALTAINTLGPCLAIDVESGAPYMGSREGYGWLSGPSLKPLALRCVYDIARTVDVPILGVGGISRGLDAVEMSMAGATAVQICTAAILRGPRVFGEVAGELRRFMEMHDYATVKELTGLSIRLQRTREFRTHPVPPQVTAERCTACGLCAQSCVYNAITVDNMAYIDENKCFGCGLCVSRCKGIGVGALAFPKCV